MSAFEQYLIKLGPEQGAMHLIECLKNGPSDTEAWNVMEQINGSEWKCPPEYLPHYCLVTVIKLNQTKDVSDETTNT